MTFTIFSTLDNSAAISSPVLGAGGEGVGTLGFDGGMFNNGVICYDGFVRFPTRDSSGEELVTNSACTISMWFIPHFDTGGILQKVPLVSLYNDDGSRITVFYDDTSGKFGFTEGGVGQVLESSGTNITAGTPIRIALTWDGYYRSLYINGSLAVRQDQGAEFMPDQLVLGRVRPDGFAVSGYSNPPGVFDNLKVETEYRTDFTFMFSGGIETSSDRLSFTRTVYESERGLYLSAHVDDQRNALLNGSGCSDERCAYSKTGSYSSRASSLETRPGSVRQCFTSLPAQSARDAATPAVYTTDDDRDAYSGGVVGISSSRGGSLTALGSCVQDRYGRVIAIGECSSERDANATGRGAGLSVRAVALSCKDGTSDFRAGATSALDGVRSNRSVLTEGGAGTVPTRTGADKGAYFAASETAQTDVLAAVCGLDSSEDVCEVTVTGSLVADDEKSALAAGSVSTFDAVACHCPCEIPRDEVSAYVPASAFDADEWLGLILHWAGSACSDDPVLSAAAGASGKFAPTEPGGWRKLRRPSITLASARAARREQGEDEAYWHALLDFDVRAASGSASKLAARFNRVVCSALRNAPVTLCGPFKVDSARMQRSFGAFGSHVRLKLEISALVTPAKAVF
ncbi:MAG: hypothetical protein U5N86_04625 [Planctomycetota bacterium]|nr:hypothetical protein [Planctomycetota bacterium]